MPPINGFAKANSLDRIIEIGQQSNYVSKPSEESAPKTGDEKLAPPPQNPAVPGGRIYSDAIAHADELPGAGTAVTDTDRARADATARALSFKGLDDFIARLRERGGEALAPGGALVKNLPDPDATLTLVAVRLLNSDAVAWKADRIGNGVAGKVNDYDKIVDEIDDCIRRIRRFAHPETGIMFERAPKSGGFELDTQFGRFVNPGHALEGLSFIMRRLEEKPDAELLAFVRKEVRIMGEFGWDGAACAYTLSDPANRVSAYFAMHVRSCLYGYLTIHPTIRDLIYEGLKK